MLWLASSLEFAAVDLHGVFLLSVQSVKENNSNYLHHEDLKTQLRRKQKEAVPHLSVKWAVVGILPSLCSSRPVMFVLVQSRIRTIKSFDTNNLVHGQCGVQ